jgi:hypothetical protein
VQNTDATHNPLTERVITHLFWNEHGNSSFLALESKDGKVREDLHLLPVKMANGNFQG